MTDAALDGLLAQLRSQARVRAVCWLSACNDLYLPLVFQGFRARITITGRSAKDQEAAKAAGLSDVKLGWHQFGLAWDFAVYDDKGGYVTDGSHPAYALCGQASLPLGCHYPIILSSGRPDADHVEYHPSLTLGQMIAADASGKDLFA